MNIELEVPDNIATVINDFLQFQANKPDSIRSHGPLDMQTLALMLLQDVYWSRERPARGKARTCGMYWKPPVISYEASLNGYHSSLPKKTVGCRVGDAR